MSSLRFGAKRTNTLLPKGAHKVTITSAIETINENTGIPELEVTFQGADKVSRKNWYNLMGFRKNAIGDFIDSKGKPLTIEPNPGRDPKITAKNKAAYAKRVEDPAMSAKAMGILEALAADCGLKGEDNGADDLVNCECVVVVGDAGNSTGVTHTFPLNRFDEAQKLAVKKGYVVMSDEDVF